MFEELVKFHGSAHISSANLMACMGSLTHIAKSRPQFLERIVGAMERLHANLPPTLSKSQVPSPFHFSVLKSTDSFQPAQEQK